MAVLPRVFVNQGSGANAVSTEMVAASFARAGMPVEIVEIIPKADIRALAREAIASGCTLLVAGGGDGTVQAVANATASTTVALGILPLGTLNHFARDLGIPMGLDDAVDIIATGHTAKVDVARLNGDLFLNTSSLGYYPEMIRKRASIRGRLRRYVAGLAAGLEVIKDRRALHVTLSYDGTERSMTTPFVFVGNNNYSIHRFGFTYRPRIDEGILSIYILRTTEILPTIRVLFMIFTGQVGSEAAFEEIITPKVRITTHDGQALVALDGELEKYSMPLEFTSDGCALTVTVPRQPA